MTESLPKDEESHPPQSKNEAPRLTENQGTAFLYKVALLAYDDMKVYCERERLHTSDRLVSVQYEKGVIGWKPVLTVGVATTTGHGGSNAKDSKTPVTKKRKQTAATS